MSRYNGFENLKVIELANVLAGPAVGMFFAELGAQVIKIENSRTGGDVTRQWKLPSEDASSGTSAYFASVNWNKEHLFLDLTNENDRAKVYSLVKEADIVISNYKAGDDVKLQMDHASLSKINPSVIYGSITGFGENDERVAYDLVLQAETGFMSMNGTEQSGPVKMPVALIDILAAHQLKEALLVALLERERTGTGAHVTVSLFDAAIASLANQASNWLMANHVPLRMGSLHPNIAPYGEIFSTADNKQIVLAVGSDKQFLQLCHVLDAAGLPADERFRSNHGRVKHRKELAGLLEPLIRGRERDALLKELEKAGVPAGAIRAVNEVFEMPPARRMVLEDTQDEKRVRTVAFKRLK
jgi:crotonobetainyl-CoA:carnitine CoA-transferase CaiB-like acyl-CoA transferase